MLALPKPPWEEEPLAKETVEKTQFWRTSVEGEEPGRRQAREL